MRNIKIATVATVLGIAICAFAIAQGQLGGARHHGPWLHGAPAGTPQHPTDTATAVEHLTEVFAKFAPFDANKDGQIDATEKESLAKAIADGTLQVPAHTPPNGTSPSAEMILNHIRAMYAQLAPHDTNHDGALDATEQAALESAIEKGELSCQYGEHPCGVGGHRP